MSPESSAAVRLGVVRTMAVLGLGEGIRTIVAVAV
jgi:hypothetical protein